jgi:hypothetical protein
MRQQAEEMQRANQLAEEAQEEAKRKASEENSESFASALGLSPIRPSLPRQQLDEMKRANDLAEDANFQHRMDRMHADIQRLTDRSRQQISQPQSSEWVLKYNPYTGRYQYVPPNAQLKYNALENRYEWVP